MATRAQSKSAAAKLALVENDTDADEVDAPRDGSNQPPVLEMEKITILANQAFLDDDEGNQKKGTGQQRMTAAILALYARWEADDFEVFADEDDGTPELGKAFAVSRVRQVLLTHIRKVLLPADTGDKSFDEKAAYDATRAAHGSLLNVGVKVAAVFHAKGIGYSDYDESLGMFRTTPDVLLPKGTMWKGKLANDTTPLLLNQRTFSAYRNEGEGDDAKEVAVKIKLSVTSILNAARSFLPKPKKDEKDSNTKSPMGDAQVGKPEDTALTIGWLIRALHAKTAKGFDYKNPTSVNGWVRAEEWTLSTDYEEWSKFVQDQKSFDKMALDNELASRK